MITLKKVISVARVEWLASLCLCFSIGLTFAFSSKIFLPDWIETGGVVRKISVIKDEHTVGAGTNGVSTSVSRCWLVSVEYKVFVKTYVTHQESKNTVSSKCDSKEGPYPQALLPKIGDTHPVWYDSKNVSIAILNNTFPLASSLGFFVSFIITVGFLIFFKESSTL